MPTEPAPSPRAAIGARGEDLAADHLRANGYIVLARNWRLAAGALRGELDLICRAPDGVLTFVEVKTRRAGGRFGGPAAAVTPSKQAKIRSLALAFLDQSGLAARALRFDVIGIEVGPGESRITHIEAAF